MRIVHDRTIRRRITLIIYILYSWFNFKKLKIERFDRKNDTIELDQNLHELTINYGIKAEDRFSRRRPSNCANKISFQQMSLIDAYRKTNHCSEFVPCGITYYSFIKNDKLNYTKKMSKFHVFNVRCVKNIRNSW